MPGRARALLALLVILCGALFLSSCSLISPPHRVIFIWVDKSGSFMEPRGNVRRSGRKRRLSERERAALRRAAREKALERSRMQRLAAVKDISIAIQDLGLDKPGLATFHISLGVIDEKTTEGDIQFSYELDGGHKSLTEGLRAMLDEFRDISDGDIAPRTDITGALIATEKRLDSLLARNPDSEVYVFLYTDLVDTGGREVPEAAEFGHLGTGRITAIFADMDRSEKYRVRLREVFPDPRRFMVVPKSMRIQEGASHLARQID